MTKRYVAVLNSKISGKIRKSYKTKKGCPKWTAFDIRAWRRPTFPSLLGRVSSALVGLTSLFGMGRGDHHRYNRHSALQLACANLDNLPEIRYFSNKLSLLPRIVKSRAISTARLRCYHLYTCSLSTS